MMEANLTDSVHQKTIFVIDTFRHVTYLLDERFDRFFYHLFNALKVSFQKQQMEKYMRIIVKAWILPEDINFDQLQRQLPIVVDLALPNVNKVTSIWAICDAVNTQIVYKSMLSEVHHPLKLYLTVPITSATSERTFSALKEFLLIYAYLCQDKGLTTA